MQPTIDSAAVPGTLAPVAPGERIIHLDVLRGIALFGVLIANIWLWFSGTIFRFPELDLAVLSLDTAAFFLVAFFVSGKAMTTFSFLFGLGFAVQIMRAEAKDRPVVPVFARRMSILFIIGAVHAIFLWYGDILATYALLGFLLLLFQHRTNKTLLVWALVLVVVWPLLLASIPLARHLVDGQPAAEPAPEATTTEVADVPTRDQELLAGFISGEPARVIEGNLKMLHTMYRPPRGLRIFVLLGVFLLGLYVGRRRIFENPSAHRKALRRLIMWGFPIGFVATLGEMAMRRGIASGPDDAVPWLPLAMAAIRLVAVVPFAFAYIAATTLLLERARWRRLLAPFAPVGRMALTNYIAQTVICLVLYIGAGLMVTGSHAVGLVLAFAIFGGQMIFSAWWLRHYRYGPLEWLWRSATYRRLQPMRLAPPEPAAAELAA